MNNIIMFYFSNVNNLIKYPKLNVKNSANTFFVEDWIDLRWT